MDLRIIQGQNSKLTLCKFISLYTRLTSIYSDVYRFRYIDNPRKNCQWLPCEVSDDSEILSMQKWWGKLK